MTGWTLLAFAIAAEVLGTTALRASNGLTRVAPIAVTTVAYVTSFALLALTLKHLSLGTTYAIWSGVGTVAIAFIGRLVYHEVISFATAVGIALVIGGVVLIHLGGGVSR
jgi:small multidrug resistance pump